MGGAQVVVRVIREDELTALLALYRHLHVTDQPLPPRPVVDALWARIRADPALHYLVAEVDGVLAATCTIAVIPNLTRGARSYGLIENVVTDPAFRRRGLGRLVLAAARDIGWAAGCYKVMLMTGRRDEATLRFYASAGFLAGEKSAFVAYPPASPG